MPGPCGMEGYRDSTSKVTRVMSGSAERSRASKVCTTWMEFFTSDLTSSRWGANLLQRWPDIFSVGPDDADTIGPILCGCLCTFLRK